MPAQRLELPRPLVQPQWLAQHLSDPNLVVLDGTFYLPNQGKNARAEFQASAISGAKFFDIDQVAETGTGLPHMAPSAEIFASACDDLGITAQSRVVIYDQHGLFSAARVWWTFRLFGHEQVSVLDGGLPGWIASGGSVGPGQLEQTALDNAPGYVVAQDNRHDWIVGRDQLVGSPQLQALVVDARPADRFTGQTPEPRAGMASGHIPGSSNLPFPHLTPGGRLADDATLAQLLDQAGVTPDSVTSCGSGVTAAIIVLACAQLGRPLPRLYDGSWADWGRQELGLPVVSG